MMLEGTRKMECWRDTAPVTVEVERQEVSESEAEERQDGFGYDQHC